MKIPCSELTTINAKDDIFSYHGRTASVLEKANYTSRNGIKAHYDSTKYGYVTWIDKVYVYIKVAGTDESIRKHVEEIDEFFHPVVKYNNLKQEVEVVFARYTIRYGKLSIIESSQSLFLIFLF